MTRKLWAAILLLAVAASISIYVYQKSRLVKVASLEHITPNNELIYYIYSYDLDNTIKEFHSSPLFLKISGLSLYKEYLAPKLQKIQGISPNLTDLVTQDTALATFSLGKPGQIADFLFLSRLDMKKYPQIKKKIAEFYLSQIAREDFSVREYEGIQITNFKFPQEDLSFNAAIVSDVLLISNNLAVIEESIGLFKKKSVDSLYNFADFQKIKSRLKKETLLWGYQNCVNYAKQMLLLFESQDPDPRTAKGSAIYLKTMRPILNMANVFKESIFYLDYSDLKDGIMFKGYATFDRSKDEIGFLDTMISDRFLDKGVFNLIPKDIFVCYAGRLNALNYWNFLKKILLSMQEAIKDELQAGPQQMRSFSLGEGLKQVDVFLEVSIEKDILPLLEDNSGFVFADINEINLAVPQPAAVVPEAQSAVQAPPSMPMVFPQIYGFYEVKDRAKLQDLLQKATVNLVKKISDIKKEQDKQMLMQAQASMPPAQSQGYNPAAQPATTQEEPITFKTDIYKGVNISYLALSNFPVAEFKPNYVILDKYLIFSFSIRMTKQIIDVYSKADDSIASNFDFKTVQNKLDPDYYNMMFFDLKRLINSIKSLKIYNKFDNTNIGAPKGLSKQKIDDILDVLSNISKLSVTSRMSDAETIESSSYIEIEGLQ
ncbi:MAG: hypothetical protein Q8O22_00155 [Candidatus Omnitrophota bacterium]|nr:hypothetical protein [Candidatus Omnitrophota bacterium]